MVREWEGLERGREKKRERPRGGVKSERERRRGRVKRRERKGERNKKIVGI